MSQIFSYKDKQLSHGLKLLSQGEPIAFPTETVYGLGADARDTNAVRKILFLKNRPPEKGINVLCSSLDMIKEIGNIRYDLEYKLIEHYMPGPLTIVLDSLGTVGELVAREDNTVGVRIPDCMITLDLISSFGYGLATTSANKSGGISPRTAEEVQSIFGDTLYCIDGGVCTIGVESTIVRVIDQSTLQILREGALHSDIFVKTLGISLLK